MKNTLLVITATLIIATVTSVSAATPWSCKDTPKSDSGYNIYPGKLFTCESSTRYNYAPVVK